MVVKHVKSLFICIPGKTVKFIRLVGQVIFSSWGREIVELKNDNKFKRLPPFEREIKQFFFPKDPLRLLL